MVVLAVPLAGPCLVSGRESTAPRPRADCQLHVLAALDVFERGRIAERVRAGLARVRMNGKRLGRSHARLAAVDGLGLREAADRLGVSRSTSNGGVETAHGLAW